MFRVPLYFHPHNFRLVASQSKEIWNTKKWRKDNIKAFICKYIREDEICIELLAERP
jgi:hypothetical protein